MKKKIGIEPSKDEKYFSFPSPEKALIAFNQASRMIEDKFFMDSSTLVKLANRIVTVPIWFPFSPKET